MSLSQHFVREFRLRVLALILIIIVATASQSSAQINSFTNSANSDWHTGGSWSLGVAPGLNQTATFLTNVTTKTVTIEAATPGGNLTISNLTVAGPVNSTNTLLISGNATPLTILNSFTNSARGIVIVTNAGLQVYGTTRINGEIRVQAGASVSATGTFRVAELGGSSGTVTISGGSVLLNGAASEMVIGHNGNGTLLLSGGYLVVTNAGTLTVGRGGGGQPGAGTITMSGGFFTNAAPLQVGVYTGIVQQTGGTWIQKGATKVSGVKAEFTLLGGTFIQTNTEFKVGGIVTSGVTTGRLTIGGGALFVDGNALIIGGSDGAVGHGNMLMTNGLLVVRGGAGIEIGRGGGTSAGHGTVTFSGGLITNTAALTLGSIFGSTGTVIQTGGTWLQGGATTIGGGTSAVGSVTISGGVFQATNTVTLGTINGANKGTGSFIVGGTGQVTITNATGNALLNVKVGELKLTGGALTVDRLLNESGGVITSTAGQLIVSGFFTNAGTLNLNNTTGSFGSRVVNTGTWITDATTAYFTDTFSNAPGASFHLSPGATYTFRSNFVSQISNAASYTTLGANFVFDGNKSLVGTQSMQVAGVARGGSGSTLEPVTNNIFFTTGAGTFSTNSFRFYPADPILGLTNNFALGGLTVGSLTTTSILNLTDAFLGDSQTAGLYVAELRINPGSLLIISSNVHLYFQSTNSFYAVQLGGASWDTTSSVWLMNGAGYHQLVVVPEPSVFLLLVTGLAALFYARRRRS